MTALLVLMVVADGRPASPRFISVLHSFFLQKDLKDKDKVHIDHELNRCYEGSNLCKLFLLIRLPYLDRQN